MTYRTSMTIDYLIPSFPIVTFGEETIRTSEMKKRNIAAAPSKYAREASWHHDRTRAFYFRSRDEFAALLDRLGFEARFERIDRDYAYPHILFVCKKRMDVKSD